MPEFESASPSSLKTIEPVSTNSASSPDSGRQSNSGCSSMSDREESYECYGQRDDLDCEFESVPDRIGDEVDGNTLLSPPHSLPPGNFNRRNSWVRRSLRCSPSTNGDRLVPNRRWGSFRNAPKRVGVAAVASQLYRTSSFSSGRSSVPDQDEMFSDESLEDNVIDLNQKVQMLQKQIGTLGDNQMNIDDRYSRTKQENAALQARISMLEEQLRETEQRAEDRLVDEQKRNREMIGRVEREKQLTVENYSIKHSATEKEHRIAVDENERLKVSLERLETEKAHLKGVASDTEFAACKLQEEKNHIIQLSKRDKEELRIERERSSQVIEELRCEIERLRAVEEAFQKRSPSIDLSMSGPSELQTELKTLKQSNKDLVEQVDELQAELLTSRLEEGRTLVATNNNSLAAEFEQMSSDEDMPSDDEPDKLRGSLKAAQEEIGDLKRYIDNILINIVESHPELLEVKQNM